MDNQRFDSLTRALAIGTSRRTLLKLLAGGAAAGGVAEPVAQDQALAECHGIACSSGDDCCTGAPECSGGVCVVAMSTGTTAAPAAADTTTTAAPAGGATTVPSTGVGPGDGNAQTWLAAAVAGGAAAWLATRLGRKPERAPDESV